MFHDLRLVVGQKFALLALDGRLLYTPVRGGGENVAARNARFRVFCHVFIVNNESAYHQCAGCTLS